MRKISVIMLGLVLMVNVSWASGYLLPKGLTDLVELPRLEFGLSRAQITQRLIEAGWQEVTPSDTLNAKEFYWVVDTEKEGSSVIFANGRLFLRGQHFKGLQIKLIPVNRDVDALLSNEFVGDSCWIGDNGNSGCSWTHKQLPISMYISHHVVPIASMQEEHPTTTITISME